MKKKILFAITKGNFGGAQHYVYDLARYLDAEYDIAVASGQLGPLGHALTERGIRTHSLSYMQRDASLSRDIHAVFEFLQLLKKESPDIVHLNSSKAGFVGGLAIFLYNITHRKSPARCVFTSHGWSFNEDRSALSKLFFYCLHTLTVLLSDITISVSERGKKQISLLPTVASKIVVIHNGIEKPAYHTKSSSRKALSPNSPHSIWIGSIAELHSNKGLDIALDALTPILQNNTHIGLYIIGEGEQRKKLEDYIAEHGLEQSVTLLGFIPKAGLYLKAFDIYLQPSRTENFPYALLEAGLASLPTIATDVGDISALIHNKENGIRIRPYSVDDIRHSVQYLLDNPKLAEEYKKKLKTDTEHMFGIQQMLQKTKAIYQNLLP